jgi:PAS domain S-box-containing protein
MKESENLRLLLDNLNESAYLIDEEGRIHTANRVFASRLGVSTDTLEGVNLYDLLPARVAQKRRRIVREAAALKEPVVFEEEREGETYLNSVRPVVGSDGKVHLMAVVGVNITSLKEMERDLRSLNAELEGFVNAASHDLKGPLSTGLLSCARIREILAGLPDSDQTTEAVDAAAIIESCLLRGHTLVEDLLSLSLAENLPENVETVEVSEIVEEVLRERSQELSRAGARVKTPSRLGRVRANRTHLYQIFSNLISNSIRHNDSKNPAIEIRYLGGGRGGPHRYCVSDNGPGVPADMMDTVFLPFVKGVGGGHGIGLTVVAKTVRTYGGDVKVSNRDGACFEFTLNDV